jgi:hypothetical protein
MPMFYLNVYSVEAILLCLGRLKLRGQEGILRKSLFRDDVCRSKAVWGGKKK